MSVARQWSCKHAFPAIERLCFLQGPCKVIIKKDSEAGRSSIAEFRDASLLGYELESCRTMAR
jgi:hypothetical protein